MHKNKSGMMTPFKPAFGGGDRPREARGRLQLSQTYRAGQGSVIPNSEGKIRIPGDELRVHAGRKGTTR